MWHNKIYDLHSIGVEGAYTLHQIEKIPHSHLSRFESPSQIVTNKGTLRSSLFFTGNVGHGSYGTIHLAMRSLPSGEKHEVVCKQPKMKELNQVLEAILQHISHLTLKEQGIPWAVPCVYDLFWRNKETWFSMEHVRGTNLLRWIRMSTQPDCDILLLISQVALILSILQQNCGLDHRDMKIDNLMIREIPCSIVAKVGGNTWKLEAAFQVVILDFGFACLGSLPAGTDAVINLGEVLPPMDPCPKEGRDMFHFLVSILSLEPIRERMSPFLISHFDEWLNIKGKNFGSMARKWGQKDWVHLLTGQRDFRAPACSPLLLLENCTKILKGEAVSLEKSN
jgi:serine/threonine protein kinase